ncbi:MAG: hypothetical protein MUD08_13220 [Cytophagales bacterium]|nr:hypothetical protein [Cytophagales bacterium]
MKLLAQLPQPDCQVTLFVWNGKYIVKIEQGMLEQTYKLSEMDVTGEAEVRKLVENTVFMNSVRQRFAEMAAALQEAIE